MLLKALILSQHVRRGACVQAVHLPVELESQAPCRNVGFPGLGGPGVGALGGAACACKHSRCCWPRHCSCANGRQRERGGRERTAARRIPLQTCWGDRHA